MSEEVADLHQATPTTSSNHETWLWPWVTPSQLSGMCMLASGVAWAVSQTGCCIRVSTATTGKKQYLQLQVA